MAGYLCVAENKVGTVEKLFSLTVQGEGKKTKFKDFYLFIVLIRITQGK